VKNKLTEPHTLFQSSMFSNTPNTRDAILKMLIAKWPQSTKEIFVELKDAGGFNITYQGVHKILKQLEVEGVVNSKDRKYALSVEWVRNLRRWSEIAEKSYAKSKSKEYAEFGVGSSVEKNAFLAGREAAQKALQKTKLKKEPQLALVFASSSYKGEYHELLKGIKSVVKKAPIAGCSSMGGEICNKSLQKSVVVAVICAEKEVFSAKAVGIPLPADAQARGIGYFLNRLEAEAGLKHEAPSLGFLFLPGFSKKNEMKSIAPEFLKEFAAYFHNAFPVLGCLAGDNWSFEDNWQFCDEKALTNAIVFVGIKTRLKFGAKRASGYEKASEETYKIKVKGDAIVEMAKITGGKLVYEPALDAYVQATGVGVKELKHTIPFFVRELIAQNKAPPITRVSDGMNGFPCFIKEKSIRFDNQFEDGDVIQMLKTTPQHITASTEYAILEAAKQAGIARPSFALLLSCASLEAILNAHDINEIESVRKGPLTEMPVFGCYGAGEIGPYPYPLGSESIAALVFGNELRE